MYVKSCRLVSNASGRLLTWMANKIVTESASPRTSGALSYRKQLEGFVDTLQSSMVIVEVKQRDRSTSSAIAPSSSCGKIPPPCRTGRQGARGYLLAIQHMGNVVASPAQLATSAMLRLTCHFYQWSLLLQVPTSYHEPMQLERLSILSIH